MGLAGRVTYGADVVMQMDDLAHKESHGSGPYQLVHRQATFDREKHPANEGSSATYPESDPGDIWRQGVTTNLSWRYDANSAGPRLCTNEQPFR
ncbi:hypothetical protein GB937_009385 [Aspergillus fischeri]|nr:hypothetical protein GB937_009385 [Aspergillus fischeri]